MYTNWFKLIGLYKLVYVNWYIHKGQRFSWTLRNFVKYMPFGLKLATQTGTNATEKCLE